MNKRRKSHGETSTSTTTTANNNNSSTTTTWSPWMDNVIKTPKNEEERKDTDKQINNALYESSKTCRLPVFEEICPSTHENEKTND
ncbi:hypothetical protein ACOSQ4_005925 [Xanthoceras sorbifolium]